MNNEAAPFAPMASPPPELAKALGWRVTNIEEEDADERAAREFFERTTNILNPWTAKPAFEFSDDDSLADREVDAGIEPIRKLFQSKPSAATVSILKPLPIEQDPDEKEFFQALSPIQKLFFSDITSLASSPATNLNKNGDDWNAPLNKTARQLTYKSHRDEHGILWRSGYAPDGELLSYLMVIDESDD